MSSSATTTTSMSKTSKVGRLVEIERTQNESKAAKEAAALTKGRRSTSSSDVEDINKSADAFIARFHRQLLLQRLESMEEYENMLARGL
ncbi:hypothetical protein QJS04_geneDACA020077 [Acorus gramineus]|uniref:Uncharacterized protein n=1 Tax=Acorus gramineus TaxID=55184 RepID=A0AAV9A550_ACOGR|nr:hypothetical protein QJS04_geneDACA020077 [Acorus gramineus]